MEIVLARWATAAFEDRNEAAEAWLILATARVCLARHPRTAFRFLPASTAVRPSTPGQLLERADDVLLALLCSLESLSNDERAAYLLRDVFQTEYAEIAQVLKKSAAICRRLVRAARVRLGKGGTRTGTLARNPADTDFQLLSTFANALAEGDLATLRSTLAENVEVLGDGFGKLHRFHGSLSGADQVVRHFIADSLRYGSSLRVELTRESGIWVLSFLLDDEPESMLFPEIDGFRIARLHVRRP